MILMRISKVVGICEIEYYNVRAGAEGGWFPIGGVQFGFSPQSHQSQTAPQQRSAASQPAAGPQTAQNGNGSDSSAIQITKNVDYSTVSLMKLAMEARTQAAGKAEIAVQADIHFIGSLNVNDKLSTFTFVRIHLEGVEVSEWRVSGSGEQRPTENITLVYEKSAFCYESTDGKAKLAQQKGGWDQTKNEPWDGVVSEFYPDFPKSQSRV